VPSLAEVACVLEVVGIGGLNVLDAQFAFEARQYQIGGHRFRIEVGEFFKYDDGGVCAEIDYWHTLPMPASIRVSPAGAIQGGSMGAAV
jgi:hypothetical protein